MSGRLTGCAPSGNGTGRHDLRPAPATPRLPASSGRSASQRASSASRCRPSQRPAGPVGPLGRPGDLEGMMEPGSGGCLPLAIPAGARLWECRNLDWGYAIACGHHSPLHATRQGLREVHDDMQARCIGQLFLLGMPLLEHAGCAGRSEPKPRGFAPRFGHAPAFGSAGALRPLQSELVPLSPFCGCLLPDTSRICPPSPSKAVRETSAGTRAHAGEGNCRSAAR